MKRLPDWLAYLAFRLGTPGLLGLALLAVSLGLVGWVNTPLWRAADDLETRLETPAREPAAQARPESLPEMPGADAAPAVLAGLFAAARHAGLELDEGNYRVSSDRAAGLVRHQISLPLSGTWPALRGFLAEALNRHPSLALEGLRMDRGEDGAEVQATLRLTLYLREGP